MPTIKSSDAARELVRAHWSRPDVLTARREARMRRIREELRKLPLTPEEAEHLKGEVMLDPHKQAYAGAAFARIPERNNVLDPAVAVVENMYLYRANSLGEMAQAMPDPDLCHEMAREYELLAEELHWH